MTQGNGSTRHRRLLNVTIVNCYPDHNKGSAALAAGLITRLRATEAVGVISVVALPQSVGANDFRHLHRAFPDVRVLPSPLRDHARRTDGWPGRARQLAYAAYIGGLTAGLSTSRLRARVDRSPAIAALANSDLILERGGPFFKGMGPPPNPSLLRYAWPLEYAMRSGIPYGLIGESVGPLGNRWAKHTVRRLFLNAAMASVREDVSRSVLVDAGVPAERVYTTLDNAFWTAPRRSEQVDQLLRDNGLDRRRFVAVTVRDRRNETEEETYLRELAKGIDALLAATPAEVGFEVAALVPNLFNPAGPAHDDRRMTRRLAELVTRKDAVRVVDADLGADELAAFYGEAALVVGHRLHSLILGIVGGSPVVGIASSVGPKTVGVLELLGLGEFAIPIKKLRSEHLVALARAAPSSQGHVAGRVRQLREHSDREFNAFVRGILADRSRSAAQF